MNLVLDAGVLSNLCHPNPAQAAPVQARLAALRAAHTQVSVYVPETADFEVRRKLIHLRKTRSLARLDALHRLFAYLAIDTSTMRLAAQLWAEARWRGQPTAGTDGFDVDVVLAALALGVGGTVATTNVRHLSQFVPVQDWT
jgi:predicted nucleic acid-binding protein